jgi:hypothetical protein
LSHISPDVTKVKREKKITKEERNRIPHAIGVGVKRTKNPCMNDLMGQQQLSKATTLSLSFLSFNYYIVSVHSIEICGE